MNVLGLYEHEYIHIYAHICVDLYMYTYVNKLHSMCEKNQTTDETYTYKSNDVHNGGWFSTEGQRKE